MKTTNNLLTGVLPVLPTIFDNDGKLDEAGQEAVVEYIIAAGADGIVFPGLASEWEHLSPEEREHLVQLVGKWVEGRVSFIVGASAHTPEDAAKYAVQGADAGATAAMILTPPSLGTDVSQQAGFYRSVAKQAGLPLMLQNAPGGIGVGLSVHAITEVVEQVEEIRFVKEETMPCGQRISALIDMAGDHVDGIYGGAGGRYILDEMQRGAVGTLPACEITEVHVRMVHAFRSGNHRQARDLFELSLPLLTMQAIFRWRLTKFVLKQRGVIQSDFVRAPGPSMDEIDKAEILVLLGRISETVDLHIDAEWH